MELISVEQLGNHIPEPDYAPVIAEELELEPNQVKNTLALLGEGATVPFIARYRKEATLGLDEVQIAAIRDRKKYLSELHERKLSVLHSIAEQGKLTGALLELIIKADTKTQVEDLYLPFKKKRLTRAAKARQRGLEPLAMVLLGQEPLTAPWHEMAAGFVSEEVPTPEDAISGARDIIAEIINENAQLRASMRSLFWDEGIVESKIIPGMEKDGARFADYFDFTEPVKAMAPHRILAVARGEREEVLSVHITVPWHRVHDLLVHHFAPKVLPEQWELIYEDAYKRLLHPSIESDTRRRMKESADIYSVKVFSQNVRELLMAAPLGQKRVLAIDPGYRTGCKVVVLDETGRFLTNTTIYPHKPRAQWELAKKRLHELAQQYSIEAVAVGNGTAGRETMQLVREMLREGLFESHVIPVQVDESGASIYSASELAREEFPDLDVTVRGAISIGRRLQDPLAELVKIDPKSLGVGQYQHDVDQKMLRDALDDTVMFCVNQVGVNLNTASWALLRYVSGLGTSLAKSIVHYREEHGRFYDRRELMNVPRLGPKAFQQCAGFLRIPDAPNPLDRSAVHPESYGIVERMAADLKVTIEELIGDADLISRIDPSRYEAEGGSYTVRDIIQELLKPGRDPREQFENVQFREDVTEFEDLQEGMVLDGVVTNVTAFGAFVDIGVHQDGLVHISQLSHSFVKDPLDIVRPGQHVKVKVTGLDPDRRRISLSMKELMEAPQVPAGRRQRSKGSRRQKSKRSDAHTGKKPFNPVFDALKKK